jgi:HEPN domain-containing protein
MPEKGSKPSYPDRYYEQLLFYAKSDLEWAKSGLERTTCFYHKPCCEARECVEKSLKAFLEATGKAVPELHSLRTLIDLCGQVDKGFLRLRAKCLVLQPYQHEARYPELPTYDFTLGMADEAVAIAAEIYEFVERKIQEIERRQGDSKDECLWVCRRSLEEVYAQLQITGGLRLGLKPHALRAHRKPPTR